MTRGIGSQGVPPASRGRGQRFARLDRPGPRARERQRVHLLELGHDPSGGRSLSNAWYHYITPLMIAAAFVIAGTVSFCRLLWTLPEGEEGWKQRFGAIAGGRP